MKKTGIREWTIPEEEWETICTSGFKHPPWRYFTESTLCTLE